MIVAVTQEHIDKGNQDDCRTCAFGLALLDIPGVVEVNVDHRRIKVLDDKKQFRKWKTPHKVVMFVCEFDRCNRDDPSSSTPVPEPFTIDLGEPLP